MSPTELHIIEWLTVALFVVTTVFIAAFIREPWWRAPFGRSVMVLSGGLWLYSGTAVLHIIGGSDYPGRALVVIGALSLVDLAMVSRTLVVLRAQRRNKQR